MIKEKILADGILIAPIRWSDSYMKVPYAQVMSAKYSMYDLDWKDWKRYAIWKSDSVKQVELFNFLGLGDRKKYNLVNTRFGSTRPSEIKISVGNDYPNIEMYEVEGYSIFDWELVIRHASEIHTVSTSLLYILEVLDLRMPIHLYPRRPVEENFSLVEFLFTKQYILHE